MEWSVPITGKMNIMKSILIAAAAFSLLSTAAFAGQPERPGAFGRDRAAGVHNFQSGAWDFNGTPDAGASEWGQIAGERADQNGAINREYKDSHDGSPTQGSGRQPGEGN
jgi:hypothetical protein